jgi:hypothetical protein
LDFCSKILDQCKHCYYWAVLVRQEYTNLTVTFLINRDLSEEILSGMASLTVTKSSTNSPARTLKVTTKSLSSSLTFQSLGQSGAFRTTAELAYTASPEELQLPQILPVANLQTLVGSDIYSDVTSPPPNSIMIRDHVAYYELKHKCFVQWLSDNYFLKVKPHEVDFIAFHGRIADPLKSPACKKHGRWEIYGMNVDSIIYLWDEKVPLPQASARRSSYAGHYFEKLVSSEDPSDVGIVECDKVNQ